MQTVVLKTFDDYFSANILLTRLQHEGIPCYLFDEHTVTVNPIFGAVIGGIKLVVSKGYEEAAKRLINRFEEEYQQQVHRQREEQALHQRVTVCDLEEVFGHTK